MTEKIDVTKQYKKKIKELKLHNKLYFGQDSPKISDLEYDKLKIEIINLEKKYPFLIKAGSINKIIGSEPSTKFKKIKHLSPMLSLSNAFEKNDMEDFLKKVKNFLNIKNQNIELIAEPKIDGISATLIYEDGKLTKGLSRGDGVTGEDILENLKTVKNIPKKIESSLYPKIN